jgi:arylsulfatase
VDKSIPNRISIDETLDIGFDSGTPLNDEYDVPFKFTGQLKLVTIELN